MGWPEDVPAAVPPAPRSDENARTAGHVELVAADGEEECGRGDADVPAAGRGMKVYYRKDNGFPAFAEQLTRRIVRESRIKGWFHSTFEEVQFEVGDYFVTWPLGGYSFMKRNHFETEYEAL